MSVESLAFVQIFLDEQVPRFEALLVEIGVIAS